MRRLFFPVVLVVAVTVAAALTSAGTASNKPPRPGGIIALSAYADGDQGEGLCGFHLVVTIAPATLRRRFELTQFLNKYPSGEGWSVIGEEPLDGSPFTAPVFTVPTAGLTAGQYYFGAIVTDPANHHGLGKDLIQSYADGNLFSMSGGCPAASASPLVTTP